MYAKVLAKSCICLCMQKYLQKAVHDPFAALSDTVHRNNSGNVPGILTTPHMTVTGTDSMSHFE